MYSQQTPEASLPRRLAVAAMISLLSAMTAQAASINILAIQICDDDGNNCANGSQQWFDVETQKIWDQASLTINVYDWITINDTDYLTLAIRARLVPCSLRRPAPVHWAAP